MRREGKKIKKIKISLLFPSSSAVQSVPYLLRFCFSILPLHSPVKKKGVGKGGFDLQR